MASIKAPRGANKKPKSLGRGHGTGHGKTSARGHKGQRSRSGGGVRPGFEGGQMPLYRRVARRGFTNARFKTEYLIVNLSQLAGFSKGETVSGETLREKGLVKGRGLIKVLGVGDAPAGLNFDVDKISGAAAEKIEKAGGTIVKTQADSEHPKGTKSAKADAPADEQQVGPEESEQEQATE